MTLLDHRNTATTKKLDFKNSHLTSVGATITRAKKNVDVDFDKYSNKALFYNKPLKCPFRVNKPSPKAPRGISCHAKNYLDQLTSMALEMP
jgi:hypothetical protein